MHPSIRLAKIGVATFLGLTVPSDGQQIINGSRTLLGNWDASGAATTKPVKAGTVIPATCGIGEIFFKTDANPGANLYLCTTINIWTPAQGAGVGTVTNTAGALTIDLPLFGAGGNDSKTGTKTGTGNQVVVSQAPTIVSPTIADFTNMAHSHANTAGGGQLGISALLPTALSGNGNKLGTVSGTLNSGNCTKIDTLGNLVDSGSPCVAPIASVFGRTGAVTGQMGDYNFSQISGTATAGQLPASIQYFSSGTGAPGGVCTTGQNTYLDTNLDYWFCDAANAWKKVLSTTNTGPFALTGQTGTAPSTPAAGYTTIYLSSADKTLHTVSDAGADMRYAGLGEANAWGAYLQDFSGSTVRLPVAAGFTAATNGAIGYDSTANRLHTSISLTDSIIPNVGTTPPVTGNCVKWGSNYQLQDNGVACGGGSGVTSVSGTAPIIVASGTTTPAITYACLNNSGDSWISGWGQQPVLGNNSSFTTASGTGGANGANTEELRRVWFCGGVVNKIVYEVTTAQTTGTGHWSWGLYNSAGTLVLSTGQLGLSSGIACSSPTFTANGVNTVTSSSTNCGTASVGIGTNIPAGYYYEGTVADTVTPQFRALTFTTTEYGGSGLLQNPNNTWGKITGTSNGVLLSLPTLPPPTVDNAAVPTVVLVN